MQAIAAPLPQVPQQHALTGSRAAVNAGRVLSGIAILFLAFDAIGKLVQAAPVVQGTAQLGYPASVIFPLGAVLFTCVAIYAVPATSVAGAILLTGYLGGAVATHVRVGDPLFSHVLFPVYVAAFVWGGLVLRDRRVRLLLLPAAAQQSRGAQVNKVISRDGTAIAYQRIGNGPPLILVDGALCSRAFGPMPRLAQQLASRFTVYLYDRRGRGDSGDNPSYAREREIEDLAALVEEAGGSAFVAGLSSGAALALEAAASGLKIRKLAAYEPPYLIDDAGRNAKADHQGQLRRLIAAGRRGAAVKYFMREMVGVPAPFVFVMQLMPATWRKLKDVAHTLPYDAAIMGDWSLPAARLGSIQVPVVAMHGGKTDPRLQKAARAVAAAVPNAHQHVLEGQSHDVNAEVLARALVQHFTA